MAILSLGAVSAQDNGTDDVTSVSQDNSIQLTINDDSKLSDDASTTYNKTVYVDTAKGSDTGAGSEASPYETINKAISDVNASDNAVIYLGSGTFSGDNNTNLKIDLSHRTYGGSLTLIGSENGTTVIDGSGDSPIFTAISSDSIVTLKNILFTNGKANMGSVVTSAGDLTIDNCVFEENYVTNLGAVYSENGNLTITNSKFNKNSGNQYVDLYFSHNGLVTLINNTFENGVATSSWADTPAVYVGTGKSVIRGNTFKNLTSSRSAAALAVRYNNGDNFANITDNTFINCTYTGSNGGIVFFQNSYLKGNKFINCTSRTSLLYSVTDFNAKLAFEDVAVDGTRFTLKANVTDDMGNTAQGAKVIFAIDGANVGTATSGADGIASITVNKLLENGEHTISGTQAYDSKNTFDVTVINGTATVDFDHTPAEVWVSTEGNDTTGNGSEDNPFLTLKKALDYGTAATVDLTVHIKNGLYNGAENRDLSYSNVGKITIIGESYGNVIIDAEHAKSGDGWWASGSDIFTFGQNLEIELVNLSLINCEGNPVDAYGLTMKDNIVINSSTIRAQSPNEGVIIDNIKIINGTNQAINAYNLVLTNSVIENCNGKTSTGLLWLTTNGDRVTYLENNTFKGNTIEGYSGGAAYYVQSDLVSINNTFDSNTVTGTASNIAYATGNNITSINDKFINNEVPSYVAQYRSNGNYASEIIVENITFINNRASANGAGLVTTGANIKGGKFINNTAAGNGGAIYLLNHGKTAQVSEMSIEDVTFENNTAACGNDIFIAPGQGNNVFANLTDLTITANSKNVTELSDIITVTVSHPSGAIIGGGQVTFYFDGDIIGKADLINENATLEYVGFKNDTEYKFTSVYEYATENDTYVDGVISTNIAEALDSIELYVSDSLGDDENGTGSEDNPFKSISKALSEGYTKSTNITVHVLEGNYTGELNTNLRIPTTVDVLLVGAGADKVIISDSTADYFITALAGNAKLTLANVTINRAARDTQSAIYVEEGANMEIDNVKFIGGQGNYGGAINTAGTLTINNSYFFDNGYGDVAKRANAYYGGAIYNDGILIIDNSTFEANHAGRLSTIANQGTLYMKNSKVIDSLDAYAMNMDLVAIGAFGGQKGNITIENTIFTVTNRTVDELSKRIYMPQNSLTCLAIGSCEHVTIINSTFEDQGGRYTPNAFGGINSWNLAGGGYTMVPGDIEVYNSTFRNLQSVSLFYTRSDGTSYHSHRVFDGCLFENVEYIIAALNSGNFSVDIHNSVILSDDISKIGIAAGKTIDMDISDNWWGSNNATFKNATIGTSNFISNYVLKIREISSEVVNPEDYLVLTLNQTANGVELAFKSFDGENLADYEGSLPAREFTMNATGAVLGINNGTIANKVSTSVAVDGESYEIEATVDNQTVNLTVIRKDTQISIDAINNDLSINGTLTDIEGNPISNATVSYEIGDVKENVTTDENGNFNIPCVANGDVLIKFEETGNYFASNKTFTFNGVVKENSTTVIIVPEEIKIGDDVAIFISVENATGNLTLVVDGVVNVLPLEDGIATYIMNAVPAGEHSIVAVYSGDDAHNPSYNVTSFNIEVFATEFANLTLDGSGFIDGVLVNNLGDAMNNTNISYTLDGVNYNTTTDEYGAFLINISGSSAVELSYAGDDYFLPTKISIKLENVAPTRDSTVIVGNNYTQYAVDYYAGERGQNFTTQLVDMMGNPLVNKTVFIGVNGVMRERTTDANGFTSVQINFKDANRLTFAVAFLGDENYNATMQVYLIIIEKKPVTITAPAKTYKATAKTKKYTVTLKTIKGASADGKTYFGAGKKVTMKINGKTYTAKTNAKGQATFSLKITKKGKFAATIKYAGDTTYKAVSKSVKITIK
ncbi:beta strand repeat-containing protein [Methanobrevibacter sp.]|uniref:beta strand repeat-containing protein n=1 Tax=Methanobrevibacter sp. TaxID=66852 RepID=UPI00388F7254